MLNELQQHPLTSKSILNDSISGALPGKQGEFECFNPHNSIDHSLANEVKKLVILQYGDRYPNESLYSSDYLVNATNEGIAHSLIYRDPVTKKLLAYGALTPLGEDAWELGKIIVSDEARGRGLGNLITEAMSDYALNLKAHILYAWTYASHDFSQKMFYKNDFRPVGLNIADWKDVFGIGSRESAVLMTKIVNPDIQSEKDIYVTESLMEVLGSIYSDAGCKRNFVVNDQVFNKPKGILSITHTCDSSEFDKNKSVFFFINNSQLGSFLSDVDSYSKQGAEYFSARFSISDPLAPEKIRQLSTKGFKFASVMPSLTGDILTMQLSLKAPDRSKLKLAHLQTQGIYNFIVGVGRI